ncbi:MAG: lipoate--protein ligase family protein [Verrucomicrobiota bacterium]|nr:lipoate--protein ligase family protein [Verrucomicrobiota bacterium]
MNWLLLNSGPDDAAFNMALDEALLEAMRRLQQPVLRFYGWTERAASFGYFQKFAEVGRATRLRPLVRRPTGGGLVPHDADWTYSLVFPPGHEWHGLKAVESYRRVHGWIQEAFQKLRMETELARFKKSAAHNPQSEAAGRCFIGHEQFDLLRHGKKIAGAAQRRNRLGLLIQGSVQPPSGSPGRADWERAMCEVARSQWGGGWSEFAPDAALLARTRALAHQKYSQPGYNEKR